MIREDGGVGGLSFCSDGMVLMRFYDAIGIGVRFAGFFLVVMYSEAYRCNRFRDGFFKGLWMVLAICGTVLGKSLVLLGNISLMTTTRNKTFPALLWGGDSCL